MTEQPPGLPPQAPAPETPPAPAPVPPPVAPAPPPAAAAAPPVQPAAQPAPAAPQYGYVPGTGRPGPMPGVYFAGHPGRFVAYLIDGFILSLVIGALYFVIGMVGALIASGNNDLGVAILFIGWIVVLIVGLAWFPYWWSKSGQTPGLKIMHLKVVRAADGGTLSLGGGFIRLIGYWVSAFVFYLGFIWILVDDKRQGWHDKMAGTYVIEVP